MALGSSVEGAEDLIGLGPILFGPLSPLARFWPRPDLRGHAEKHGPPRHYFYLPPATKQLPADGSPPVPGGGALHHPRGALRRRLLRLSRLHLARAVTSRAQPFLHVVTRNRGPGGNADTDCARQAVAVKGEPAWCFLSSSPLYLGGCCVAT